MFDSVRIPEHVAQGHPGANSSGTAVGTSALVGAGGVGLRSAAKRPTCCSSSADDLGYGDLSALPRKTPADRAQDDAHRRRLRAEIRDSG